MYCALKRQWRTTASALATIGLGLVGAGLPNRGADLNRFVSEIMPELGKGSLHVQNQALGAWLARLTASDPQLLSFQVSAGVWQYVGVGIAVVLMLAYWWPRRRLPLIPEELGIVIVMALLAGPITWDHYATWAIIPAMLLVAKSDGVTRVALVGLLVVLALRVPLFSWESEQIAASWWLRLLTGTQTMAWLGVLCVGLLRPSSVRSQPLDQ